MEHSMKDIDGIIERLMEDSMKRVTDRNRQKKGAAAAPAPDSADSPFTVLDLPLFRGRSCPVLLVPLEEAPGGAACGTIPSDGACDADRPMIPARILPLGTALDEVAALIPDPGDFGDPDEAADTDAADRAVGTLDCAILDHLRTRPAHEDWLSAVLSRTVRREARDGRNEAGLNLRLEAMHELATKLAGPAADPGPACAVFREALRELKALGSAEDLRGMEALAAGLAGSGNPAEADEVAERAAHILDDAILRRLLAGSAHGDWLSGCYGRVLDALSMDPAGLAARLLRAGALIAVNAELVRAYGEGAVLVCAMHRRDWTPFLTGLARAGLVRTGTSKAGPSKAGPSKAGPSKAGPSKAGPSKAGQPKARRPKTGQSGAFGTGRAPE